MLHHVFYCKKLSVGSTKQHFYLYKNNICNFLVLQGGFAIFSFLFIQNKFAIFSHFLPLNLKLSPVFCFFELWKMKQGWVYHETVF